jgi:D-alanyl-D-alanine endopeptidase (penicillin-binding protein 7)
MIRAIAMVLCLSVAAFPARSEPCAKGSFEERGARHGCVAGEAVDPIAARIRALESDSTEALRGDPELRSSMALVVDEKTGRIIYAKNADVRTPIASITKLMTAMVTLDARLPMDEKITISDDDVDRVKGTHSRLAVGTVLSRYQLLQLALVSSENRAAAALARTYPGGVPAFVAAMNRKAQALGMHDTVFVDSTGLRPGNQSTAADLARMVKAAHGYPVISEITTTASFDVAVPVYKRHKALARGGVVHRSIAYRNTNKLVSDKEWEIGLSKTGYISEAGHCLVMQAQIANQPLIIVLLDSDGKLTRITDANRIKRWLENSFAGLQRDG